MALPDGILACKFLNNASISEQHQQSVRATLTELTDERMKEQLCKIFYEEVLHKNDESVLYISQTGVILEVGLITEEELSGKEQQIKKHIMEEDSKDLMRKEDRI